jgi:hypothetical protein
MVRVNLRPRGSVGLRTDDVLSRLLAHARKRELGGETSRLEDSTAVNQICSLGSQHLNLLSLFLLRSKNEVRATYSSHDFLNINLLSGDTPAVVSLTTLLPVSRFAALPSVEFWRGESVSSYWLRNELMKRKHIYIYKV